MNVDCPSDNDLQEWIAGHASTTQKALWLAHIDTCGSCTEIVGALHPVAIVQEQVVERTDVDVDRSAVTEGTSATLVAIGRYWLRRVVGTGGMGVVYEAFDPDLMRIVAIKVLRPDLDPALHERLQHEAQAMAKLQHPNVLAVHDAGVHDGRTYVVMALVRGCSLRVWMQRAGRTYDKTIEIFLAAGRGLEAAHHAGLVHRDFKPDNVLLSDDGQVVVSDFGLAVANDRLHEACADEGSALYMAPEQRRGDSVDARSDQFSYAIALREALEPKAIPRNFRPILDRASATNPAERYASMGPLLVAIEQTRRRTRRLRSTLVAACAVVPVAAAMFAAGTFQSRQSLNCGQYADRIQTLWNPRTAAQIGAHIRAIDSPLAKSFSQKAEEVLPNYFRAWAARRASMCNDGTETTSAGDVERACLDDRLERSEAVTALLSSSDGPMLEHGGEILAYLEPIEGCRTQPASLPNPPPAEQANEVFAIRRQLHTAEAYIAAARYPAAVQLAHDAADRAQRTHFLPVVAEAVLAEGIAEGRLGHLPESRDRLERASLAASASGERGIAIRAWVQLMHFAGSEGKDYAAGERWDTFAREGLARINLGNDLEGERRLWLRAMLVDQGRLDDAKLAADDEWNFVLERLGQKHRLYPAALDGKASLLAAQCRSRDALAPQQAACDAYREQLGSPHPMLAVCLNNLGGLYAAIGDHDRSLELKHEARRALVGFAGHDGKLAMIHRNIARSELEVGHYDVADAELAQALQLSHTPSERTAVALLHSESARLQGQYEIARKNLAEAKPDGDRQQREALLIKVQTAIAQEHPQEAIDALAKFETEPVLASPSHRCKLLSIRALQAVALFKQAQREQARMVADATLDDAKGWQVDPLQLARLDLVLAASLPAAEDRRSLSLIQSARELLTHHLRRREFDALFLAAERRK
jgi:eukaryotic-like serine/threonine-protein kinase